MLQTLNSLKKSELDNSKIFGKPECCPTPHHIAIETGTNLLT